jgi:hypothetical protein
MTDRTRVAFVVYVDLDPVPGEFYSKESAQHSIRNVLVDALGHYDPIVSLAPLPLQPEPNMAAVVEYLNTHPEDCVVMSRPKLGLPDEFINKESKTVSSNKSCELLRTNRCSGSVKKYYAGDIDGTPTFVTYCEYHRPKNLGLPDEFPKEGS